MLDGTLGMCITVLDVDIFIFVLEPWSSPTVARRVQALLPFGFSICTCPMYRDPIPKSTISTHRKRGNQNAGVS